MMYESILQTFAAEAAAAAKDAHDGDNLPPAVVAWDFVRMVWEDAEEPALAWLPEAMPPEFPAMYAAAVAGALGEYQTFDLTQLAGGRWKIAELGCTCDSLEAACATIDAHCETLPVFDLRSKRIVDYGLDGGAA